MANGWLKRVTQITIVLVLPITPSISGATHFFIQGLQWLFSVNLPGLVFVDLLDEASDHLARYFQQ